MKDFFAGHSQKEIRFGSFTGKAPMFCRDVHLMGALFPARLDVIRQMLPTPGYAPLRVAPDKGLVALFCIEYRHSDVGPYNEVALSLLLDHGRLPLPGAARLAWSALRDNYHAFVQELPVNSEISVRGGRDVFNYPKYLADISFSEQTGRRTCTVTNPQTQKTILAFKGTKQQRAWARPKTVTFFSYTTIDGQPHQAQMRVRLQEYGISYLRHPATLHLGSDARARSFRRLNPGRALYNIYAPRCQAILFEPTAYRSR